MYSVTIFKSMYDNKTHRRLDIDTWDQFTSFLQKLSERPLEGKKNAELISPAIYKDNTTRANRNVLAWASWAAVDVDDHELQGDLGNELRNRFGSWSYVCYSTASSTTDHPKFRLVFQLARSVNADEIKHFWYALNTEIGSIGDKQTKDLSRMYYIPASYVGANNFFFTNDGLPVDVDSLLSKHPYEDKSAKNFIDRLPEAWREQIIEHRKAQLENTDITWTSYSDCPFWPKKLAAEYMTISSTGWYTKMYQIMIAIAGAAVKSKYPITPTQIAELCKQFDVDTGNWYENRPLETEANNALEYAYKNSG
jgi:hypothetical protein